MTCIVGLVANEEVWMGSDSAAVAEDDSDLVTVRQSKIFQNKELLIGFAGSFRVGQLLRYSFEPSPVKKNQVLLDYFVYTFVEELKEMLRQHGCITDGDDGEEFGASLLVGCQQQLFVVDKDFCVYQSSKFFESIGAGSATAKGALFATTSHMKPEKRILTALNAAFEYCTLVRPPFTVLRV